MAGATRHEPPPGARWESTHTEAWTVIGASVTGTSHLERDTPCQDAHAFLARPDGALLVAVADGAGSASHSDLGAVVAVERALEVVDGWLDAATPVSTDADGEGRVVAVSVDWREVMETAFHAVRGRLDDLAADLGRPVRALACTLNVAVALPDRLIVAQVGDCAAVARGADDVWFTASEPQRGEYANEAFFVTMPDALDYLVVDEHSVATNVVAVTSDGLLRLALDLTDGRPHTPFFEPLASAVRRSAAPPTALASQLAVFLASERVNARTDDDKTLVLAVRPGISTDTGAERP